MTAKNFDVAILDFNDKPVSKDDGKEFTLKDAAITALSGSYADEQNLSGEDKFKRFEMALKVSKGNDQDYTPEEIVLIKKLTGKAFGPLVTGRMFEVLNA